MKRIYLAAALAAAILTAGCNGKLPDPAAGPRPAAEQTVLDEKAAIAVETAWATAGTLIETATDAGFIKGATASRIDALDARAERAVKAVRAAYDAGNAASYDQAVVEAIAVISEITRLVNGGQ